MDNETREAIAELLVRIQNLEGAGARLQDEVVQQRRDIDELHSRTRL